MIVKNLNETTYYTPSMFHMKMDINVVASIVYDACMSEIRHRRWCYFTSDVKIELSVIKSHLQKYHDTQIILESVQISGFYNNQKYIMINIKDNEGQKQITLQ